MNFKTLYPIVRITLISFFFTSVLPLSAYGCWVEVTNFDPCDSPISGNTDVRFDAATGLYTGYLENTKWKAKVGYGGGSINEIGASCESALATNPSLVCPVGNHFFNRANGDPFWTCEEFYSEQAWWGYWLVNETTCTPGCRHTSTIAYTEAGGDIDQVINDHWTLYSQQVVQLWKWVPGCEVEADINNSLGPPSQCYF